MFLPRRRLCRSHGETQLKLLRPSKATTTVITIQDVCDSVRVRSEFGDAEFKVEPGKVPQGMAFVPYGPPTCKLMGGNTDGTGMPTSKGWEVDVEPAKD